MKDGAIEGGEEGGGAKIKIVKKLTLVILLPPGRVDIFMPWVGIIWDYE